MLSDGVLGLVDAIRKFDGAKRVRLGSYVQHRIRGAILEGLCGVDPACRDLERNSKTIQNVYRDLEVKLGRPIQDEEMAAALGMNLAEWYRAFQEIQGGGSDFTVRAFTAGTTFMRTSVHPTLLAKDSPTAGPSPFDLCHRREQRDILHRAVSCLREL